MILLNMTNTVQPPGAPLRVVVVVVGGGGSISVLIEGSFLKMKLWHMLVAANAQTVLILHGKGEIQKCGVARNFSYHLA
jgi:hypothetical protein